MTNPPSGAPDYFALFQSMFMPPGAAPAAPASPLLAMLDPKELERKISELETVLAWLKGTTGMIEMSLQTMRYQQTMLNTFADAKSQNAPSAQPMNMEDLAKMAGAMNPAVWAMNMMQAPETPKGEKAPASATPRKTAKKARR